MESVSMLVREEYAPAARGISQFFRMGVGERDYPGDRRDLSGFAEGNARLAIGKAIDPVQFGTCERHICR
jgi:hypothetical protein